MKSIANEREIFQLIIIQNLGPTHSQRQLVIYLSINCTPVSARQIWVSQLFSQNESRYIIVIDFVQSFDFDRSTCLGNCHILNAIEKNVSNTHTLTPSPYFVSLLGFSCECHDCHLTHTCNRIVNCKHNIWVECYRLMHFNMRQTLNYAPQRWRLLKPNDLRSILNLQPVETTTATTIKDKNFRFLTIALLISRC